MAVRFQGRLLILRRLLSDPGQIQNSRTHILTKLSWAGNVRIYEMSANFEVMGSGVLEWGSGRLILCQFQDAISVLSLAREPLGLDLSIPVLSLLMTAASVINLKENSSLHTLRSKWMWLELK